LNPWQIAVLVVAVLAAPVVLIRLHRMLLRWEERGWIYYTRKKPTSGGLSCLSVFQEAIEPGYQHVAQLKQQRREVVSQRDLILARLLSCLQAEVIDEAAIGELLTEYGSADWAELYAEAARLAAGGDVERAASFPTAEQVAPAPTAPDK
jgi:hypothetical protein